MVSVTQPGESQSLRAIWPWRKGRGCFGEVMLPRQRSTSLESPCSIWIITHRWAHGSSGRTARRCISCLGNWVQEMQRVIWTVCLFTRCLSDFSTLLKRPHAGTRHRSLSRGLGEHSPKSGWERALCAALKDTCWCVAWLWVSLKYSGKHWAYAQQQNHDLKECFQKQFPSPTTACKQSNCTWETPSASWG